MRFAASGSSLNAADSPSRAKLRELEAEFDVLPSDDPDALPPSSSCCSVRRLSWSVKLALILLVALIVTGCALLVFSLSPPKKSPNHTPPQTRVVINTWWPGPTDAAFDALAGRMSALDSAIAGAINAEENMYDHTVGPDGSPDTNGETTLDALIVRRRPRRACAHLPATASH